MSTRKGKNNAPEEQDERASMTLLHCAASDGLLETCAFLIQKKFDVNAVTTKGFTPLHGAVICNHQSIVELLLQNGANPNALNFLMGSPIIYAALEDFVGIAKTLIKHGADIHIKDKFGCTPLHIAASKDACRVISLFLKSGAKVHAKDNEGKTPLDLAKVRAATVIRRHMAKMERANKKKFSGGKSGLINPAGLN